MRFLAPKWFGWEQQPWGLVQRVPAARAVEGLAAVDHSAVCSLLGACQDRVSGQLIKTKLMTAERSASRTLGILVHGSLSFEGCLPAQPRWEEVALWQASTVPAPAQKAI